VTSIAAVLRSGPMADDSCSDSPGSLSTVVTVPARECESLTPAISLQDIPLHENHGEPAGPQPLRNLPWLVAQVRGTPSAAS
jgi:hypothetical protein